MPFKTLGLACIVVILVSTHADAQNVDFAKLLNTINYAEQEESTATSGDASEPAAQAALAPHASAAETAAPDAATPQPIPRLPGARLSEYGEIRGEPVDPLLADDPILSDDTVLEVDASAAGDDLAGEANASPAEQVNAAPQAGAAPQRNAAENAGTGRRTDQSAGRVDFSAILGSPAPAGAATIPQPSVQPEPVAAGTYHGHSAALPSVPPCDCAKCRDALPVVPHLEHVDLPPPTSLEAYYRTPACYRGLWSGYEQQRQRECQRRHKHLPGHMQVPMH